MYKLTYLIFRFGHPDYIPLPVTGNNGHRYGHATWDPSMRAHVFRFTQKEWEGTPAAPGAYAQILKRANRGAGVWNLIAKVEFDPTSAAGEMAERLDAAKAETEGLRVELEELRARYAALDHEYHSLLSLAQGSPPPDAVSPAGDKPEEPVSPAGDTEPLTHEERLEKLGFDALGAEIEEQNAAGAGIDMEPLFSKAKRRAALLAWYNT